MIYIGDKKLGKCYLGDDQIKKIYLGDNLLYPYVLRLPEGYTKVEYIQCNGSQFIAPRVPARDNSADPTTIKITMDIAPTPQNATKNQCYFGYSGWGSQGGGISMERYSGKSFAILTTGTPTSVTVDTSDSTDRRLVVLNGANKTASVGNTQISLTGEAPLYNFYLLALNHRSYSGTFSAQNYMSGKLYGCKIEKMGALVRDFVPCIDPSGVVGLYDIVNGVFYKNAGTGSFTAGPAVGVAA